MKTYFLVPKMRIQNANAASSPYTVGFPAMTAWLGMVHALQRRLQRHDPLQRICLSRTAVVCHSCELQVFKDNENYYDALIGTANPLKKSKKTGGFERPPFVEEARCHLTVSLLIEVDGLDGIAVEIFEETARQELPRLKAASGEIFARPEECKRWKIYYADEYDEKDERKILAHLMPGYAIVQRGDLLKRGDDGDALDSLLDVSKIRYQAITDEQGKIGWQREKVVPNGWLVPIAVGFRDLSGEMTVRGQRSYDYEHHFVEPLVTVGEFVMPYRCNSLNDILWEYQYDKDAGLYMCQNNFLHKEED
ncbi:type I-F CRISPR-associated protein Csy2 [Selenomonas ruminis]|uniref:Type I-F CRISPR-associated protein Csy2 n=1 Tax=Selenomonas ruminis TaxID=2593411 RepID=A0A5D6W7M0_9FIRM|nr:type I-F CRISPR-associated protein Csy2 [Selenomonas sp. mPRGC5]TYZ22949.1 type I-F CRISPR-associated protein Csy2 [Selenomonas sp. mPRGC5]